MAGPSGLAYTDTLNNANGVNTMKRKPNPFRYNITAWDNNGNRQIMHAATMKGILSQYNAWLTSVNGKLLRPTYHTIHVSNAHGEKLLDLSNIVEV